MLYGLLRCHNTNTMQPFVDWGFLTKKKSLLQHLSKGLPHKIFITNKRKRKFYKKKYNGKERGVFSIYYFFT